MTDTIEIGTIQRLNVKPGETLVVTLPDGADKRAFEEARAAVAAKLPEGVEVLIKVKGVGLEVIAKPRYLPRGASVYGEERWAELERWLRRFGVDLNDTQSITLTDDELTVASFKLNAEGRRYSADGEHVATTYLTMPLAEGLPWFDEVAV